MNGFLGIYVDEADVVHLEPGASVSIEKRPYVVRALRRADKGYQVAFEGVDDRNTAEELRGLDVGVAKRRELEEGEYWPGDLVGLTVVNLEGAVLGTVSEVAFGAAQDRLVVATDEGTFEVPFVDELVPEVDLEAGLVRVVEIPGLISDS